MLQNIIFWAWHDHCILELSAAAIMCKGQAAISTLSWTLKGLMGLHPLPEDLLEVSGCWRRRDVFFGDGATVKLCVLLQISHHPCSSE